MSSMEKPLFFLGQSNLSGSDKRDIDEGLHLGGGSKAAIEQDDCLAPFRQSSLASGVIPGKIGMRLRPLGSCGVLITDFTGSI